VTAVPAAADIIRRRGLKPHPEGGHFRETCRDRPAAGGRGAVTHIHYLLARGERSHWHRIDAVEIWHHYAGGPLALSIAGTAAGPLERVILGPRLAAGQRTHAVVPAHAWQAAESLGAWSLVGCTVAPAFDFGGFELAPAGWTPGT
jgi:predicted cupin superfamily sugar epimerase